MQRLFARDRKQAGDGYEAYYQNHDPICQCQDMPDKFPVQSVKMVGTDGANIAITRDDDKQAWTLVIKKEGGKWKIYDVVEHDGRSIRALLTRKFGKKVH